MGFHPTTWLSETSKKQQERRGESKYLPFFYSSIKKESDSDAKFGVLSTLGYELVNLLLHGNPSGCGMGPMARLHDQSVLDQTYDEKDMGASLGTVESMRELVMEILTN